MSLFDGIIGQLEGSDAGQAVLANLAAKVGLTPEQAQSAIGALASAHAQPGDTVQTASASTGFSQELLQQVLGHLGGEGALGPIAESMLGGGSQAGNQQGDNQQAENHQGGGGLGGVLGSLAADYFNRKG